MWQSRVMAPRAAGSENGDNRVGRWGGVFVGLAGRRWVLSTHTHTHTQMQTNVPENKQNPKPGEKGRQIQHGTSTQGLVRVAAMTGCQASEQNACAKNKCSASNTCPTLVERNAQEKNTAARARTDAHYYSPPDRLPRQRHQLLASHCLQLHTGTWLRQSPSGTGVCMGPTNRAPRQWSLRPVLPNLQHW